MPRGVALAREHHPDLIVLDWTMPGMSGIEVVRALRDLPGLATTPVIMTSAETTQQSSRRPAPWYRCLRHQAFDPAELMEKIQEVLTEEPR